MWSVATLAGIYSVGTSLATASSVLPRNLFTPQAIALGDPLRHFDHPANSRAPVMAAARDTVHEGKSARLAAAPITAEDRFERVAAALSPGKLAAAFARSGTAIAQTDEAADLVVASKESPSAMVAAALPLPDQERFERALAETKPSVSRDGPAATRFGPRISEVRRSSRLALALAGASQVEIAFAAPADMRADGFDILLEGPLSADLGTDMPAFESVPDSVPLPSRRPQPDRDVARSSPSAAPAPRPAKRSKQSDEDMLAYARPDTPAGGLGQAFKNFFNPPSHGSGVAIYDISAATVYMPNGQKLEAHSGLGHMVDKPRYVREKNRGPTPPNTYDLVMRESRFHGVEAIRLIPADGKNKYGRDGLLAHTYMLRGGRAESNGCVVFKDYRRFLNAFKKGKIKRLVVVPGRRSQPGTQVASDERGA